MEQRYNVIITPDAAADLSQIKSYIAYTLQAPDTALKYIRGLRQEICKLDSFPAAIAYILQYRREYKVRLCSKCDLRKA